MDINNIFKAYDVRGRVGSELTVDVVEKIGRAMADWLPEQGQVAVGRDMRPDSQELAESMIKGLQMQGRDVLDIGLVTSDMIYFAVGKYDLAGGAVITASHNPGAYNGIKLCREEAKPIGLESGLDEIRDKVLNGSFSVSSTSSRLTTKDVTEDWIDHVLSFIDIDKLKPLKIAVDAGNGMAGKIFPEIEPYLPFELVEMYFELDGTFPNHEANPLKFETLKDIIKVIKDNKLDAGVAFDGDGDRAFLIDETGAVLTGGVMSAMLSEYFLRLNSGANIIYDARNSRSVPDVIEKAGGKPVRTRVGHALMKAAMREANAPFGGEASGHFYFKDNWYADSGLIAAIIGLYVLSRSGKKLSQLRQQYTHYAAIPETNFIVKDKDLVLKSIKNTFKDAQIDELDGVTLTFKDGWMNIRGSNTEPLLRLNAEADSQSILNNYVNKATKIINH
jgi:phosphomannomutase